MDRRSFIKASAAGLAASSLISQSTLAQTKQALKAKRLKKGDKVVLVAPASATFDPIKVDITRETFEALGLKVTTGKHILDRHGYLAGTDKDRAADINTAFADPSIKGIIAIRGGWGCNRILPYLDYKMIAKNPKVLLGYSDITSLMNALYTKTGLQSFHGPVGLSYWGEFQAEQFDKLLFKGDKQFMQNFNPDESALAMRKNRIRTVVPGKAQGVLVGGNLTVLASMIGSEYVPDMTGKILMLEDVDEAVYRVDRYMSTLQLSGVLDKVAGVVFGHCTECDPKRGYGGFTLFEVMQHYLGALKVPSYFGAQFGHIEDNHILPVGCEVEIDASKGTLRQLKPALV